MNDAKPTCGWNEANPYRQPESEPPVLSSELVRRNAPHRPTPFGKRKQYAYETTVTLALTILADVEIPECAVEEMVEDFKKDTRYDVERWTSLGRMRATCNAPNNRI